MNELSENIAMCERCAAGGGVALPVMSLPHQHLAKQTAKAVNGRLEPLPMFGQKIRFGADFVSRLNTTRPT